MNKGKTSKELILSACRRIVAEKGLDALNMRAVAAECRIALGTLYNYYENKEELLLATVESIWQDIFHANRKAMTDCSFSAYIGYLYDCVQEGTRAYPDFFTAHSVQMARVDTSHGKKMMGRYFQHMKHGLSQVLKADPNVDPRAFPRR